MAGAQWTISGEYFENCNCDVICPCEVSPQGSLQVRPDQGECRVYLIFHINEGRYGGVDLKGLNVAIAAQTPGVGAAILDEVDYWWQESVNAAEEVVAAIRPAMASLPGTKLIAISSPYTPVGWLHHFHRAHWGQPGRALVWKAPSLVMNPTLDEARITTAVAADPERGRAEWEAEWRAGAAALFDEPALLDACSRREPLIIPPQPKRRYAAGVDPSGGGADEFTWSIAHRDGERVIVDLVAARGRRGRQPLDLEAAVRECAEDLHVHGLRTCTGDRYSGAWVLEAFARHGIRYRQAEQTKSECYLGLLPLVTARRLEVPEDVELTRQMRLLERRRGTQGKDIVDHPVGAHDDRVNAAALAVAAALARPAMGTGGWRALAEVNDDLHEGATAWLSDAVVGRRPPRGL
jgi:hypothetical protein